MVSAVNFVFNNEKLCRAVLAAWLTIIFCKNVNGFSSEDAAQLPNLQSSESWSLKTIAFEQTAAVVFVLTTLVVLAIVLLFLAVTWRQNPSLSSAVTATMASLGLVHQRRVPSKVRHRLRLRLPANTSMVSFNCSPSLASAGDSPSVLRGWAPRLLAMHASQQQHQLCFGSDSSTTTQSGSQTPSSLLAMMTSSSNRQSTPSDLLPVDYVDEQLTFFNRRLELLGDD